VYGVPKCRLCVAGSPLAEEGHTNQEPRVDIAWFGRQRLPAELLGLPRLAGP
jgi:hypothetical protein